MKKLVLVLSVLIFYTSINAQWQQTNGPFGSEINAITVIENRIIAGTQFGIYKSGDNGQTWEKSNTGLTASSICALFVKGNLLFASSTSKKIFLSNDFGSSWLELNTDFLLHNISALFAKDEFIFLATSKSIYRSSDNGSNWTPLNNGIPENTRVRSFAKKDEIIFAGTDSKGIYRTTDNGENWTSVNSGLVESEIRSLIVKGDKIFAGALGKIFVSTDEGNNWNSIGPSETVNVFGISDTYIYAAIRDGLYRSPDEGITWNELNYNIPYSKINDLVISGNNIYTADQFGMAYSNDSGETWSLLNNGMQHLPMLGISGAKNNIFVSTLGQHPFHSTNMGESWNYNETIPWYSHFVTKNDSIFAGNNFKGVYLSTDNGLTWSQRNNGLDYHMVIDIVLNGNDIFVTALESNFGAGYLFKSTNNGSKWSLVSNELNGRIKKLVVKDNILFATSENIGVFRSTDLGMNWTSINNGLTYLDVGKILVNGYNLVITVSEHWQLGYNRVAISTNNGDEWHLIDEELPDSVRPVLAANDKQIFVGNKHGDIFRTSDSGASWQLVNEGMEQFNIWSLGLFDEHIFAGTYNNGLWRRPLSDFPPTNIEDEKNIPTNFSLEQNYPNPFNPTTTIKFSVADAFHASTTHVTLKIYDLLGNEITTLVNEQKQPGVYKVTFDGSNLSSGVYFYSLKAAPSAGSAKGFTQTKKLILMK